MKRLVALKAVGGDQVFIDPMQVDVVSTSAGRTSVVVRGHTVETSEGLRTVMDRLMGSTFIELSGWKMESRDE